MSPEHTIKTGAIESDEEAAEGGSSSLKPASTEVSEAVISWSGARSLS